MHGAPSKSTAQLSLAERKREGKPAHPASHDWQVVKQDNWTGKQGPVQKHRHLNHTTIRSRKKKNMSSKN